MYTKIWYGKIYQSYNKCLEGEQEQWPFGGFMWLAGWGWNERFHRQLRSCIVWISWQGKGRSTWTFYPFSQMWAREEGRTVGLAGCQEADIKNRVRLFITIWLHYRHKIRNMSSLVYFLLTCHCGFTGKVCLFAQLCYLPISCTPWL